MISHHDQTPPHARSVDHSSLENAKVIPFPLDRRIAAFESTPHRSYGNYHSGATPPGLDEPLSPYLVLAIRTLLRHRPHDRACALAIIYVPECGLLEETFGSEASQELGHQISERLIDALRKVDTLLQIDIGAYAVLLDDLDDRDAITTVLKRLHDRVVGVYRVADGLRFSLNTKVGVALYPEDTGEPEDLVRFARVALRHADAGTLAAPQFFEPPLLARLRERVCIATELQWAIDADRLELHYQPQYAADTGERVSAEALLRLRNEAGELVMPERFIGIAEETGLILPIGRWVIREACQQLAKWRAAGIKLQRIAVNLSPHQLLDEAIIPTIRAAVEATGIAFGDLELELTEAQMVAKIPLVEQTLAAITALGVRIAVDDFGTGYSALSYLSRLPLDVLKIDRSFIQDALHEPRAGGIIGACVAMAKELHLEVTAEGIENEQQRQLVVAAGCNLAQGFHLARPLPPEQWQPA